MTAADYLHSQAKFDALCRTTFDERQKKAAKGAVNYATWDFAGPRLREVHADLVRSILREIDAGDGLDLFGEVDRG